MLSLDSTSALTIGCGRCRFLVSSSLHCWNRMKLRSKGLDSRRKALRTSRSNWMKLRSGALGCWNLRKKIVVPHEMVLYGRDGPRGEKESPVDEEIARAIHRWQSKNCPRATDSTRELGKSSARGNQVILPLLLPPSLG
ncbi:hypothetical protein BHE74_00009960 [Ensete ventricosum]|nr:hypothetical protein GW17_00003509 [Ensete ventricosum]RWW81628.1 hypothetical protein BHE74_00009960 [Ensete ventricosum]